MKMKLAFFLPSLEGGGAERVTLFLMRGLLEQGHTIDLVLAQARGPYLNQVPAGVPIVDLKSTRVLKSLPGLITYLQREHPDIIISALSHANVVAAWARRLSKVKTRLVLTEHSSVFSSATHAQTTREKAIPYLLRWSYRWADAAVAVSQGVATELIGLGLPKEKVRVIYNPVVTQELYTKAKEFPEHPWLRPGQPPLVLAVGRLAPEKNFSLLIQAFAKLRAKQNVRLIILGEGPERGLLEKLVNQLGLEGAVDMPGFVQNPYSFMQRASVIALSSRWEALPTVLIEALALGKPVVATDCPHGPREILVEPNLGWLVPPEDPDRLAHALEEALNEGNDGAKSIYRRQDAEKRFGLEVAVEQYCNLFSTIAKHPM